MANMNTSLMMLGERDQGHHGTSPRFTVPTTYPATATATGHCTHGSSGSAEWPCTGNRPDFSPNPGQIAASPSPRLAVQPHPIWPQRRAFGNYPPLRR